LQSSIGISSAIVENYREGYGGKSFQYIVGLSGSREKILDNIGFSGKLKRGVLEENKNVKGRKILARVKEISESRSDVYDLEVENDPSYVANGFISHNSAEGIQRFKKQGIPAEVVSVDRTTEPYDMLKSAIYEDRIEYYNYPPFLKETKALEIDRVKGKVDHPLSGSKDCSDAVAGIVYGLHKKVSRLPLGVIQHGTGDGESEGDYSWVMKNRKEPVLTKGKTGLYHRDNDDIDDIDDDGDDGLMPFVMGD